MKETTSLHVIPLHPENYSTIYDYDSYLDQKSRYNQLFLDADKLKKTYSTEIRPQIKKTLEYPSVNHQMKFDFRKIYYPLY